MVLFPVMLELLVDFMFVTEFFTAFPNLIVECSRELFDVITCDIRNEPSIVGKDSGVDFFFGDVVTVVVSDVGVELFVIFEVGESGVELFVVGAVADGRVELFALGAVKDPDEEVFDFVANTGVEASVFGDITVELSVVGLGS